MRAHALVDLYVPARLGSPRELQFVAAKAGLEVLVRVVEDAAERPTPEELAELDPHGPRLLQATAVSGPGFRFVCFLPPGSSVSLESLEAAGDARLVQATLTELGGVAVPVTPRQGQGGGVAREVPALGRGVGVVALAIPGSRLGRDLDLEDAAVAERAVLAASGPFATLTDVGRYATLMPLPLGRSGGASDETVQHRLISALLSGHGIAVEQIIPRVEPKRAPDPREGRDDDGQGHKKRRRRRRPKKKAEA